MPHPDALEWDRRYSNDPRMYAHAAPRSLLTANAAILPPAGLALDAACGASASGLYLSRRGWRVIGLDVSEVGLRLAQRRARRAGLELSLAVMDLDRLALPAGHFDLVLDFYFLVRSLWETYRKTLKPGGLLFFETFLWTPGGRSRRDFFLQPGELRAAFEDWDLLHYEEGPRGRSAEDPRRIARMIARKPAGLREPNKGVIV